MMKEILLRKFNNEKKQTFFCFLKACFLPATHHKPNKNEFSNQVSRVSV